MFKFAMILGVGAGLLPVGGLLGAQEIKVRVVGDGKAEVAPAAKAATRDAETPVPGHQGDSGAMDDARRMIDKQGRAEDMLMADGDLTPDEINKLIGKARERLDRDMHKLEKREKENARETDPEDKNEEAADIKKDRYRASVRALERDLVSRIDRLRKPGGDRAEDNLDNLTDKVKDTFSDLQDKLDDDPKATWPTTLDVARKFYSDYLTQIEKWGKEIGVDASVPNADESLKRMREDLITRAKRLRKMGGEKYEDQFESLIDRVADTFEKLIDKVETTPPKGWAELVATGEKFQSQFNGDLDKLAKLIGADQALPAPTERLGQLSKDLIERINALRKLSGDKYEDNLDALEDKVRDTFADLKEKVLNQAKEQWTKTLEDASRFHREFSEQIEIWKIKIQGTPKAAGNPDNGTGRAPDRVDSPEKDLPLPPGVHADIVEGIRIARLGPFIRKQLALENGLEVKEITDAEGALGRLGIEVYDIVIEAKGVKVDTRSGLREVMEGVKRGEEFSIVIMRDGKKQALTGKK